LSTLYNALFLIFASRQSGKSGNDNFVRIDITKKKFVRGHKKFSAMKYKRNEWKQKKANNFREEQLKKITCKKCNDVGHTSRYCLKGKQSFKVY